MSEKELKQKTSENKTLIVIGIVIIALFVFFVSRSNSDWTLMICETSHYSGGCDDNKYVIDGYKSKKECMEKGISINNPQGFECGSSCKESDYGLQVCNEVCNETGCS